MTDLSFSVVDTSKGRPYNPPTAEEAALQSANETSETFEKTKKFEISNGLLTGQNASNTTRHVDDDEQHLFLPSAFLKRADRLPGNRTR